MRKNDTNKHHISFTNHLRRRLFVYYGQPTRGQCADAYDDLPPPELHLCADEKQIKKRQIKNPIKMGVL